MARKHSTVALRSRLPLLLLLGVSFGLNLVPFWWGLPAYPTWAPDELLPGNVLDEGQWPAKYPPGHRHLLSVVYRPLDRLMGETAAPGAWLPHLGRLQAAGRLLSVMMGVAVVYLVYRYGRLLFDRQTALLGAAIIALSPSFVYYSKTVNLETPYLFWFSLALVLLFAAARSGSLRDHLLFGATAAAAVATKDQAYGLFLASPAILVWGRLRRDRTDMSRRGGWRLLADRHLWLAVLAGAVTLAVLHRLPLDWEGFLHHFRTVTGQRTMVYQVYERSVAGQGQMLVRGVVNLAFALGVPWLVAAVVGVGLGLRDAEKRWLTAGVVLLGVGYYLGFVAVIGFHYVRFFLPLAILAAPISAWGLLRLLGVLGWKRATPAVVAPLLLFGLARAVLVDVAMLDDSRYRVEEFVAEEMTGPVLGLGRKSMLPRGLAAAGWGRLATEGCGFFDPDLKGLVVNATDLRGDQERGLFRSLAAGDLGFDQTLRLPERPGIRGLGLTRVDSNLSFINPEVWVFSRSGRPCLDRETLPSFLTAMKGRRDEDRERVLIDAMRSERLPVRSVGDAPPVLAANLRFDGWTYGQQPMAALIENTRETAVVPQLEIGCWASREVYPLIASIDDGRERRDLQFAQAGQKKLALDSLEPGQTVLVLIWSDKTWQGRESPPRPLGINLNKVWLVDALEEGSTVPGLQDAS